MHISSFPVVSPKVDKTTVTSININKHFEKLYPDMTNISEVPHQFKVCPPLCRFYFQSQCKPIYLSHPLPMRESLLPSFFNYVQLAVISNSAIVGE